MYRWVSILVLLAVAMVGCNSENPWWKRRPPENPPISKEALQAELRPKLAPLRAALNAPNEEQAVISDAQRREIMMALTQAQAEHGEEKAAQEVFRDLADQISSLARDAATAEYWRLVQTCIDVYEVLNMESYTLKRLDARAKEMLGRPKVEVQGFLEDKSHDDIYVFLKLTDRRTGKVTKVQAREGEEFNDLRLVEIIGRNKQVRFEYLKIEGLFFIVEGI